MSTLPVTVALTEPLTIVNLEKLSREPSREEPHVAALVAAARQGDRDAFGDLVTLHERVVFRTALTVLGNREEAQEATQDAFVMAWRKLTSFRGDALFRTWLLAIVWRKALDRRRARSGWWARTRAVTSRDDRDPLDDVAHAEPNPEERTLSRDLARRVRDEILRLSPKLKDTLLLAATGEHSYEEIATMLKIPAGTVKWRVSEARRIVAARLKAAEGAHRG